jgi:putative tricarboxylic transport membrane protein
MKGLNGLIPLLTAAALLPLPAAAQGAWAPQRPIEIVVPASAGGALDRPARVLQQLWTDGRMVEVPVTVSNRAGGGQSVGLNYIHQGQGDPHRFALMSGPLLANYIMGRSKLHFSDFTVLAQLFNEYQGIAVPADSPLKTPKDLIARYKAEPDALSFAIGTTVGNLTHLALATPLKRLGVDIKRMKNVAFPSAGQSMTALLGGHVDLGGGALSVLAPHKKSGKLRVLVVTSGERLGGEFTDVPTWRELGVDVVIAAGRFLVAPAGLSAAQVAWWDALLTRTAKLPEWQKMLDSNLWVNEFLPSEAARKHMGKLDGEWRERLADVGMAK